MLNFPPTPCGDAAILELFLDWERALDHGLDVLVYLIMAALGTAFFILRLGISLFFGSAGDADDSLDDDAGTFSLFSMLGVLAFFMGAGWMGLAGRIDWELEPRVAAAAAAGGGLALAFIAAMFGRVARRLNSTTGYDYATAIGKSAQVVVAIPLRGRGKGRIQVGIAGRLRTVDAVSIDPPIAERASVTVVSVADDGTFIVEPQ